MQSQLRASILPAGLVLVALAGSGFYYYAGGDPIPGTEPITVGTPEREGPLPYLGGSPTLTAGFKDWESCELGGRVEAHPGLFFLTKWGPAALTGMSGGCGSCGGGGAFSGSPETAALGLQLAPPNDIPMGDIGDLPPSPKDHPFVLADTGEVVYTEVDFVIPGIGFDLVWYRTYRSAYEFEGWFGYGWSHGAELYMIQESNGDVKAFLGNGLAENVYVWNSGTSTWTSPDGFYDQLTEGTRGSTYTPSKYANKPFLTKTEKNGVVWEFDQAISSPKKVYVCTSITDPWGNEMLFDYDSTDTYKLTKITDTELREVTFTYTGSLITQVTVSSSSTHADYGNVTIDYEYSSDKLVKVTKHKTRQVDAGTVVRPYTEYTYLTTGIYNKDLDLVKDCGTTVLDFNYSTYGTTRDRCTQVTDADGEVHAYAHEQGSSPNQFVQYTDPSGQRRDFMYTDYGAGSLEIKEVKEYLEDKDGADLSGSYSLHITRNCDCGQITQLEFPDGSQEKWTYDTYGNVTKYTRTSAGSEADLVKAWTFDTFANHCRMLTTSGWLRAEASPSSKVSYGYDGSGMLNTVTWPSVTSGQPSSQTIEWEYEFYADGKLKWVDDPNDDRVEYSYSGEDLTKQQDPAGLNRQWKTYRDVLGNVTKREDPSGTSSAVTTTVTPDGRVLKVAGANSQESKFEYDLRGRRTKSSLLLTGSTWTHTTYTVSAGGEVTQTKADDGGLNAISTHVTEEGESNRYAQSLDPDEYGSRQKWGYGSYGLPWKSYNVDDTGASTVTTLTETLERNTMGRVTARVLLGGTRIEYVYDGYGRLTETHEPLPDSKVRKTILTLKAWGAVEVSEVKQSTTLLAKSTSYYDEANRLWKTEQDDPDAVLSDLVSTYELDKAGRTKKRVDPRGGTWETQWDKAGRTSKTIDPIGNEMQHAYSDSSRTHTTTSHEKHTGTSSFTDYVRVDTTDASGRTTSSKDEGSAAGNRTTAFEYDKANRRTRLTTPLGYVTDFEYDALGRMKKETVDVEGTTEAVTESFFSLGGRRTKVKDANGTDTEWTYDAFGRELTVKYAANGGAGVPKTTTKTYDSYGRLDTVTEPMGNSVDYTYDAGGRKTQVDVSKASSGLGGPDRLLFTYDDMDRVLTGKTQQNSGGTYTDLTSVTRAYDGFGRMDSETQDGSLTITMAHDEGGAVKEITYPSGSVIVGMRYTLDDMSRATTIERKLSTSVEGVSTSAWETCATVKYLGHREVERLQSPYDLKRTQSYTSFREPEDLEYKKDSTGALKTGLHSIWDADGRMVVRERMHDEDSYEWGEVFRYDKMGRLTKMWYDVRNPNGFSASDPAQGTNPYDHKVDWSLGKVYERNSVTKTTYGGAATPTTYTNNLHYQVTAGPATMAWDDNGHMTDRGSDDFAWTALGQLRQAAISGETARDYTYDAFGRRVKTVVGSQTNRFLYHGWHMVGEYDATAGNWLWQEGPWHEGERMLEHVARDTNDLDSDSNVTEYRQYAVHEDFQDTLWGLSDTTAAVVERYFYTDPYGASETKNGAGTNIGAFATNVFHLKRLHAGAVEKVSGLYDFRNRWLEGSGGVWSRRDPLGVVDSLSCYQTLLSNPLSHADQYGNTVAQFPRLCKDQKAGLGVAEGCYALAQGVGPGALEVAMGYCRSQVLSKQRAKGQGCPKHCVDYRGVWGDCQESKPPTMSNPFWWTWDAPSRKLLQKEGMKCSYRRVPIARGMATGQGLTLTEVSCVADTIWLIDWYCECNSGIDVGISRIPPGSDGPPGSVTPRPPLPPPPGGGPPGALTPPNTTRPASGSVDSSSESHSSMNHQ